MAIGVDCDGVVHRYGKGWHDGTLYDEPVKDAVRALEELMDYDAVFIFTARTNLHDVAAWLRVHGLPATPETEPNRRFWSTRGTLLVTNRKLPAHRYIDDRAIRFTSWEQTFRDMGLREAPRSPEDVIRELHVADADGFCVTCHEEDIHGRVLLHWPCPTIRAFDR